MLLTTYLFNYIIIRSLLSQPSRFSFSPPTFFVSNSHAVTRPPKCATNDISKIKNLVSFNGCLSSRHYATRTIGREILICTMSCYRRLLCESKSSDSSPLGEVGRCS